MYTTEICEADGTADHKKEGLFTVWYKYTHICVFLEVDF